MNKNTYEFTTQILNSVLEIPQKYINVMPTECGIRVILIIDEDTRDEQSNGDKQPNSQSIEELVQEIKNLPRQPENIVLASGLLARYLAESVDEIDPDFDEERWNQEWAAVEAKMKADSLAYEQEERDMLTF